MSLVLCDLCGDLIDSDFDPEAVLEPSLVYEGKPIRFACEGCREVLADWAASQPPKPGQNPDFDAWLSKMEAEQSLEDSDHD